VVWATSRLRRRDYIAHFHLDIEPSGPMGRLWTGYKRWVLGPFLRGAHQVLVLTESQRRFLADAHGVDPRRVTVLPNGVSDEFFIPVRARSAGALRLLYVGRLTRQKNVGRLLAAMAEVTAAVQLRIVGDGEERADLEDRGRRLGLDNVTFAGPATGAGLVAAYRWADALVLTSDREGMPLVVLEAMAASLPVLATDVPGVRETVGTDGLLVPVDPAAIAGAIDRLADDEALRLDLAWASARRARRHSWATLLATLDQVYDRVRP
jgi:glycosyltransferase involved in cell wall biosynthesis